MILTDPEFRLKKTGGVSSPFLFENTDGTGLVTEADEDEEAETDEETDDEGEGDESETDDEGGKAGEEAEKKNEYVPFGNLDLVDAVCFGWSPDRGSSWSKLALESVTKGWKNVDKDALGDDLMKNSDACFMNVAQGEFVDIDSEMRYTVRFDNATALWEMSILNSPEAEIIPEEAKLFFESEAVTKFTKKCAEHIEFGKRMYAEIVKARLENGELLQVPEAKLQKILEQTDVARFMDNLRNAKYRLK